VIRRELSQGADAMELDYWFSGMNYSIGKDVSDKTSVVVEAEALVFRDAPAAILNVSKGGIGIVTIDIYFYDKELENFSRLRRFQLRECGPAVFEASLSALYRKPVSTASVRRAITQLDRKVLAFYYQWYASPHGPSGWTFHWNNGYTDHPLMGLYDSADERVIRAYMSMAKYAGIDVLVADYPYTEGYNDQTWPAMLRLADEMGLKLTHYELRRKDLSRIAESVSHPAFLTDSGRPVFFFYAPQVATPEEWIEYRRDLEARLGPMIWIGNVVDEEYLGVFDGFHTYCYITVDPGDDGRKYYSQAADMLRMGPRKMGLDEAFGLAYSGEQVDLDLKSFFLTVVPGYDDRKVRQPGLFRDREGGDMYSRLWKTAIDLGADSVLITSWNEWHEGTEIEPSAEYGFQYLELTRRFTEEYKDWVPAEKESSFSAEVTQLVQRPDLTGSGRIVIRTGDCPVLYVNVTAKGDDNVTSLGLTGDFYTYREARGAGVCSIILPYIGPRSEESIELLFEAQSSEPSLDICVSGYDPLGRRFHTCRDQVFPAGTPSCLGGPGTGLLVVLLCLRRHL